ALASGEKLRLIHVSPTASPRAALVAAAHCLPRACCSFTPLVICCQRNASLRNGPLSEFITPLVTCQRRYAFHVSTGVAVMSVSSAAKYVGARTLTSLVDFAPCCWR